MTSQPSSPDSDFFNRLSNTKQHVIALLILFVIPLVLFTATTIGGKELQRHDTTQWRAGAESVIEYRETYGKEPLWVTNMFGGMPSFVVSTKDAVPYLNNLSRFFNKIFPAFEYWVMLGGMYFLLLLMDFRKLSAVLGSVMYSLTTYIPIIIVAGHNTKFKALAFVPWLIAGYWLLARKKKKLPGLLLFSVALTLELRAGHPQITYYTFYLLGFLWVFDSWKSFKENNLKEWGVITGLFAIGGLIGIMGHAQSLLTLQEYSQYSLRGGSALDDSTGLSTGYAFAWSQGVWETLTLIVPNIFGGASPDYWGPKSFTSGPHYIGALSLPFILMALLKERSRTMYVIFAAGTLGILFSWGSNFPLLNEFAFDYIPYFDKFRAPETWLSFTAFCYSIVAVFGLKWLIDFVSSKQKSIQQLYVPIGATLAILVFLFIRVNSVEYTRPGEVANIANQIAQQNQVQPTNPQVQQRAQSYVNTQLVPDREEKAKKDVRRLAIFLAIGIGLMYLAFAQKLPISVALLGFILLVAADMISVDKRYIPEKAIVSGNVNAAKTLEAQRTDLDTYIQEHIAENTVYPYRVLPLMRDPYSDATSAYFYPIMGGYSGAKLSVIQDVMYGNGPLNIQNQNFNPDLLNLLNIKYVTYPQSLPLPGFIQVFQGQQGMVFENTNVLPKAFFVDSVITAENPKEAFDYLMPERVNFAQTAVVETSAPISTTSDSTSKVEVTAYTGPEITLKTQRSKPGFLVLSEVYYPAGWTATLNGEEIPIHKTNYFLRGLQIPEGEHTVELRFMPKMYVLGTKLAWFSLLSQLGIAIFFGITLIRNRNSSSE